MQIDSENQKKENRKYQLYFVANLILEKNIKD
jgi:hypothetical protein